MRLHGRTLGTTTRQGAGRVLGLADDFQRLGARFQDRDGFALRLTESVDLRLSRSWLNMGCRLEWIDVEGKDVAIVKVPRAASPVRANLAHGKVASREVV